MKARLTGLLDVALDLAKKALGVTRLQAKLDACSDACELSEDAEPLKPGDPAWSHAYEDVADLRRAWLREVDIVSRRSRENTKLCRELNEAKAEVHRLTEHEKKSNDRRLELVAIAQALGCPVVKEKMLERIAELKGDNRAGSFARSVNADPSAPMTATVKGGAVSLQPVAVGPTKPTWGDWSNESRQQGIDGPAVSFWLRTSTTGGIVYGAPRQWGAIGGYRGDAKDIDDAREKADAHLVSIGELEAERAFKRIGEWEPSGARMERQGDDGTGPMALMDYSGSAIWDCGKWFLCGTATGDAGKEAADAELVKRGWLDPSRAFKVANVTHTPSPLGDWKRYPGGDWARHFLDSPVHSEAVAVQGPAPRWSITAHADTFDCPDKAREAADASLVGQGRLEPSRAFERLGDWDEFVDGMWVRSSTRNAIRVNRVGGWEVFAVLGGRPVLIAAGQETCDAGKEAVDALLAQHGLLDPSRAFKVPQPESMQENLADLSEEEIVARYGRYTWAAENILEAKRAGRKIWFAPDMEECVVKVTPAEPFTFKDVQDAAEKLRAASAPKCNAFGEPDDAGTFYAANQGLPVQGPGVDLGKGGAK